MSQHNQPYVALEHIQVSEFYIAPLLDGNLELLSPEEEEAFYGRVQALMTYAHLVGPSVIDRDVIHVHLDVNWDTLSFTRCDIAPSRPYAMCYSVTVYVR